MAVVAVLTRAEDATTLMRWAWTFAQAYDDRCHVIYAPRANAVSELTELSVETTASDPILRAMSEVSRTLPTSPKLWTTGGPRPIYAVLQAATKLAAELVVVMRTTRSKTQEDAQDISSALFKVAPFNVMVLRASEASSHACTRVLVPAAGGPHAKVALKLADRLVRAVGMEATALYVEPESVPDGEAVGERVARKAMRDAGVELTDHFCARSVVASQVAAGIGQVAEQGFDLLLVGASGRGVVERALFGTIPDRLLDGRDALAVAVVRAARPLRVKARRFVDAWIRRTVPQLSREERVTLFESLQSGSRGDFDFYAMTVFATAIAGLGLLQNAPAVIIGAMLVAPLMTPMLGAGLGLIQGNIVLVREAGRAIVSGFFLALMIGVVFGWLVPTATLTPEIQARAAPNLLDLVIALVSGVAAAYAMGKSNLSSALPGVAIAAALVPPIATAGIALSLGAGTTASGAASLFGTNLVAIILGAAVAFYAVGLRGQGSQTRKRLWARRAMLALVSLTVVIALPLGFALLAKVTKSVRPTESVVQRQLESWVPGSHLVGYRQVAGPEGEIVTLVIEHDSELPPEALGRLAAAVREELGGVAKVRFELKWVHEFGAPASGAGSER